MNTLIRFFFKNESHNRMFLKLPIIVFVEEDISRSVVPCCKDLQHGVYPCYKIEFTE